MKELSEDISINILLTVYYYSLNFVLFALNLIFLFNIFIADLFHSSILIIYCIIRTNYKVRSMNDQNEKM